MTASTRAAPGRIFISYRRDETAFPAGWLFERLADHFGAGQIFKDVDSIQLGDDFVEVITAAVGSCDVLLALIGDRWLTTTDDRGRRRLDNPEDFVRLEIEAGLARDVRVIPVLVEGARMPRADELPPSLAKLVRRQALELSPSRFHFDTARLLKVLDRTLAEVQLPHAASGPEAPASGGATTHPQAVAAAPEHGQPDPLRDADLSGSPTAQAAVPPPAVTVTNWISAAGWAVAGTTAELELLKEAKIFDIFDGAEPDPRIEANGVLAKDGLLYIIFDNIPHIARISPELSPTAEAKDFIKQDQGRRRGYCDIAYDPWSGKFYILIRLLPRGKERFMAKVQEYDASFRYIASAWLDFPFARPDKGLEGLTCVRRAGQTYLLGLCQGNRCEGGAKGRIPGGGRVQVFLRGPRQWDRVDTISLPQTVLFEDYKAISMTGDRIAVVSRASSALWVGGLAPSSWQIIGEGTSYPFPRNANGEIIYGTVVGVSWIAPDQIVVVSDKAWDEDRRCRAKDQSIHIFKIPVG